MIQLLTMRWAGRTWRLASKECSVDSARARLRYAGGLPLLDVAERLEVLGDGGSPSFSTDLLLPVDVPELVERGHVLRGSPVEVAYIDEGQEWEERQVVLQGAVEEASTGVGRLVSIRVSSDPGADQNTWPPATWVCDEENYFGASGGWDPAVLGRSYMEVFGRPGVYRKAGIDVNVSGSPAYIETAAAPSYYVLISTPPCDTRAGGVRLRDDTTGAEEDVPANRIITFTDKNGVKASQALLLAGGTIMGSWSAGDQLYCQWTHAGGQFYRGTCLDRAGDILRVALERSSRPVDWRRTEPVCRSLAWELGGYWDGSTSPWEWVKSNLLPILPVSVVYGPSGMYLVRLETNPSADRAVYRLRDGLNSVFEGREVKVDTAVDTATLHFAVTASRQEAKDHFTLGADRPQGKRLGASSPARARRSVTGRPAAWELTSGMVWSAVTAGQICRSQLALRAPHVVYDVSADLRARTLTLGAVVECYSDAYHLAGVAGVVVGVRRETSRVRLSVMVMHGA